jgi:hypothetical protein
MTTTLRLLTLSLFMSSALGLTNCKKDKEPDPDKRSQREIWLTTPGWNMQRIDEVTTTPAGVVTTNSLLPSDFFAPCNLDDLSHFNADRTFTVDDGPLKCQPPSSPSTETWAFDANETEILFGTATMGTKITTLTATILVLAYTDTFSDGTTFVQKITYAAK